MKAVTAEIRDFDEMKWLVAGAGALLTLAGAYFLVTGYNIVQIERGWASFIAGAMFFSAGMLLVGIAALIARVETLAAWHLRPAAPVPDEDWPKAPVLGPVGAAPTLAGLAAPLAMRERPSDAADLPPPPREIVAEPLAPSEPAPALEPVAAPPAAEEASAPIAEGEEEPARARPAALRNFNFVFPPPDPPDTAAPKITDPPPEPVVAPAPAAPVVPEPPKPGRLNLSWLRRAKPAPAVELPTSPRISVIEEASAFAAALDAMPKPLAPEMPEAKRDEPDATEAPVSEVAPADPQAERQETVEDLPSSLPAREVEPVKQAEEKTPDPFSDDWLERALAGDAPQEPAPARFVPPSMRRAALEESRKDAEVPRLDDAPEPAAEAPAVESTGTPQTAAPEPTEIGRYKANDVSYIMYSDGSISAETANGTFRFGSLIELKNFIERGA